MARPPKYKEPKDIQPVIDKYFDDCDTKEDPYTITGLALALDLTRQGLCEYDKKDAFSDTIKKAKLRVECSVEKRLFTNSPTGAIFWLKNFGWTDKTEIKQETNVNITTGSDTLREAIESLEGADASPKKVLPKSNKV